MDMDVISSMDMNDLNGIVQVVLSFYVFYIVLVLFYVLAVYFVHGYAIMKTGHKANVNGDFMPFIPIARQIYQMNIAKRPVWYVFFFEVTTITVIITLILSLVLSAIIPNSFVVSLVFIAYFLANRIFTFLYYREFYKRFGFNPNSAWLHIIPGLSFVGQVLTYFVAFSNTIAFLGESLVREDGMPSAARSVISGIVVGVDGTYAGASFDIKSGEELTFGRDPAECNIVFGQTDTDVSRKHLSVRFDARNNQYIVTDLNSTTGTFLDNGRRLSGGKEEHLARGSKIYLGSTRRNSFNLN